MNASSGPADSSPARLRDLFPDHEIEEVEPARTGEAVAEAHRRGAAFVGVAGGDGTIRAAAAVLCGTSTPLLPIPAGTKNHFAKAVGLPTIEMAADALVEDSTVLVDTAWVNGECFVNNASIGIYPRIVRDRHAVERRVPKQLATMVAAWPQIRRLHRFSVSVDEADPTAAWMVFVGNGRYGTNAFQAAERDELCDGVLDLRVCHADARLSLLRAVAALLVGRIDRSPMVTRRTGPAFNVECPTAGDVALDGEVIRLRSPLRFSSRPASLLVYCRPAAERPSG